jgi:uncharacterized protein (TIGR03382 family)
VQGSSGQAAGGRPLNEGDTRLYHSTSVVRRAAALLFFALLAALPSRSSAAEVWTAIATEKIRPATAARSAPEARLTAARNEFEAFQIVVTGAAGNVRATATALRGAGTIEAVRLYREAHVNVTKASAADGGLGWWPDALVPDVDEIAGEKRNAFPFQVLAGESKPIWVEVFVPADAPPGEYAGEVRVTWDGGAATVHVKLTVWSFTLPAQASLKTAFGLQYGALPSAHGVSGDAFSALRARYGRMGLDHRITLGKIDDGNRSLDHYSTFHGPTIDGAAGTDLAGARLGSLQFMGASGEYAAWAKHFRAKGWFDRLFQYTCDEPPITCAWSDIPARAAQARAADPEFRTLVTTNVDAARNNGVLDAIDIIVPVINHLHDKEGNGAFGGNQRAKYDAFLAKGPRKEVWSYQSCMSHGCGGTVDMGSPSESDRYFTGWPSYMIDASAVRARAMDWLSYTYGLSGELYWETTFAFSPGGANDPWTNQYFFSGNGDGTLFYPGTPAKIGGTTHIPVASIRLKMKREGMEDYEYLKLLEDLGDGERAKAEASALFPNAFTTDVDPNALMAARERIARRIVELTGGVPVPAPGGPLLPEYAGLSAGGCSAGGGTEIFALLGVLAAVRWRRRR